MLKKNEIYRAVVTGFTSEGLGVCRVEGCAVFVPNAAPDEEYDLRIVHIGKNAAHGRIEKIITRSPHRVNRLCPYAKQCGGCDFWHLDYEAESALKAQRVTDALNRLGGQSLETVPITPAPTCEGYRNKAQFPVAPGKDGPVAGFFKKGTHEVVEIAHCRIQPDCADAAKDAVLEYMKKFGVSAYDETKHAGLVRHIYVRNAAATGEVMVCIVTNGEKLPREDALAALLQARVPGLKSVILNTNTRAGNAILGEKQRTIWGADAIEDVLCGLRFRISPKSFYQVNRAQAEVLYQKALEAANLTGQERVLDLYCGTGTITLCLASRAKEAIGVEIIEAAVRDAGENAKRNGVTNTKFFCADAGQAAQRLSAEGERPDVIVVDPPRKGLSPDVIEAIAQMSPQRVVYVSCDPATLARDVKLLTERGYALRHAEAVDLFPRCAHVETVVLLSHKKPDSVINVKVEFGEGEGKIPLDNIEKRAESYKPKERVTYKMIKEYIEAKHGFKVHTAYIAEVKRDLGLPMYDAPNAVEELKQPRKHPTPEKVEAIKDALKHFEVI